MTLSGIDLGDSPVYDITSVNLNGNSNLILTDLQYSTRQASITFTSSATPPVTVKMSIYGMILTVTQVQDKYFNATAQTAMGDVVYTFDSLYLQDVAFITGKKDAVTKLLSDSKSFVYITNRGIPYLDIYDCITITNPSQDLASVDVAPVVIKYNYDGVLSSTIIGLNKASIT
jgi:hypothetical protein